MREAFAAQGVALSAKALIALRQFAQGTQRYNISASVPGTLSTRRLGAGLIPATIRQYVPGDDIRHIERNATARTGSLHIRQFHIDRDRVAMCVADFRSTMLWGLQRAFCSVAAAEALIISAWRWSHEAGRIGALVLTDKAITVRPPRAGSNAVLRIIEDMVRAHQAALEDMQAAPAANTRPLSDIFAALDHILHGQSVLFVASNFEEQGTEFDDRLLGQAQRYSPQLLKIEALDLATVPPGSYALQHPKYDRIWAHLGMVAHEHDEKERHDLMAAPAITLFASDAPDKTAQRLATQLHWSAAA